MAGGKTRMLAKLDVDSQSEMDSKVKDWIRKNKKLSKIFGKFTYSQTVELDERKWDARKLSKALEGLVRYELKQLAVSAYKIFSDLKPGDFKEEIKGIEKLSKAYGKIGKAIEDKCIDALKELEEDKGDNKRGLKDGRSALKKLAGVELKNIFSAHGKLAATALDNLKKSIKNAKGEESDEEKAFKVASKSFGIVRKRFQDEADDAVSAIEFLQKTAASILKNKDTAASLDGFAAQINGAKAFDPFLRNLETFDAKLESIAKDIDAELLDPTLCDSKAKDVGDTSRFDRSAAEVMAALRALDKTFTQVEKELK